MNASAKTYDPIVLFATVKDTKDPDSLGRIQVELAGFGETLTLPWLRVLQPTADSKAGHFFLPEKGSEVLILRGAGNEPAGMVVLGCVYHGAAKPTVSEDGKNNTKEILTRSGNRIKISDEDGKESILIQVSGEKVKILFDKKEGAIKAESDKIIDAKTKDAKLTAEKSVTIDCSNGTVTVKAKDCNVEAMNVVVKGKTKIAAQGAQIEVKGDTSIKIEAGATAEIKAGAQLTLKGAMVNIG